MNLPGWVLRRLGIVSPTGRHLTRKQRRAQDEAFGRAFTAALNEAADKLRADSDEMLTGDEFIKRWNTPEISGPAS